MHHNKNKKNKKLPPRTDMHLCVQVSVFVFVPVKWGEAELSFRLQHVSTAPQSQKSLVVAGQIVHEFWIDPFGFYELKILFATSRARKRHGGYGSEGPPCKVAFWVQQWEGRVDKHVLCLIRPKTYFSMKDVASIMSRCLKTCVTGTLSRQPDKWNGKGWGAMIINATTKEETRCLIPEIQSISRSAPPLSEQHTRLQPSDDYLFISVGRPPTSVAGKAQSCLLADEDLSPPRLYTHILPRCWK